MKITRERDGFTPRKRMLSSRGFTLLELLIVISIIVILSVIVILVLNPSEMLKKARDSQRMADLNTVKTAIALYITDASSPQLGRGGNVGCTPGIEYIWYSKSGVSTTGHVDVTAFGTSTPSQSNAGKTDGSGWIPVNLSSLSSGSPIANWPVDPINSVDSLGSPQKTDLVYRYACNSDRLQYEVNATLESKAYGVTENVDAMDGGNSETIYEVGTNLELINDGSGF